MYRVSSFCVAAACLVSVAHATYCSAPPHLSNGWHDGGDRHGYSVGHMVTYSCYAGYRLVGDRQLTCKYGGNYVYWKGELPRCELIQRRTDDKEDGTDSRSISSNSGSESSSSRSDFSSVRSDYSHSKSDSGSSKSDSASSKSDTASSKSDTGSSKSDTGSSKSDSGSSKSSKSDSGSSKSDSGSFKSDSGSSKSSKSDSGSSKSDSGSLKSDSGSSKSDSGCQGCAPKRCPYLTPPKNGRLHVIGYYPGLYARYKCNYGYIHTGMTYRKCLHSGTWSGVEPKCIGKLPECPVLPDPSHGHIKYSEGRKVGANIWYICHKGYTLTGPESRACLRNLSWSHQAPSCNPRGCDSPERPGNGSVIYSSTSVGSKAFYKCKKPFELVGSEVRLCQASLQWLPALPKCIRRSCERLLNPKNGFVVVSSRDIGSHVKYNCHEGFYLSGPKFRECLESGWSEGAPECRPVKCDELKAPEYGNIFLSRGRYFNSTATYSCNYCYALDESSGNKTRRCQNFGEWTGKAPKCTRITCGRLQAPPNGSVWLSGTDLHSRAKYSCKESHVLTGQKVRTCLGNGNWSGSAPKCMQRNVCEGLKKPEHGSVSISGSGPGSRATYHCSPPHTLQGDKTRLCKESGKWQGNVPTCKAASLCPELGALPNGLVRMQCRHKGCPASFSCHPNYKLRGSWSARCLSNQRWSNRAPTCVKKRW